MRITEMTLILPHSIILLFLLIIHYPLQVLAQNDSIVFKNGDVIVGEVKSMDKGVLEVETDYSDSDFKIEWDKVSQFYSDRIFLITLSDGSRINEVISSDPDDLQRVNIGTSSVRSAQLIDLVYINPIDQTFLSRLSAAVSVGYNFTRSSNLSQFSSRVSLGYLADFWSLNGSLDVVTSSQDEADNISRTDGNVSFRYFLKHDWFLIFKTNFLSNDEQKLKLRAAYSAGLGKFLVHTNKIHVAVSSGAVWNNETFSDETQEDRNSAEAFIGGGLDIFDMGDLDLYTSVTVFPSLSESGRMRTDFKFDLKYDLPLDFYIQLGYTLNYDNQPIEGAVKADYVLQTTFGWDL